ncbi:MAG: agmatinase [Thermodesulfovibrionia bacterium]|nr:agmatinase [Thermodesulfovibrionia bacterium]
MKQKTPNNFCGLPQNHSSYKDSAIVIVPVPFDKTSTWGKGADKGPKAIIEASKNMELYDIETGSEVYKKGIHTSKAIISSTPAGMVNSVYNRTAKYISDGKFAVVLGGEHSVSFGSIKAHAESSKDMSILHLDAHSDMRDSYEGSKYNHACVMARAKEVSDTIVSVGIRSMDSSELGNINTQNMFYASYIQKNKNWMEQAIKKLSANVYITIDLDVFDPSIMPSTGTPEPGGLGWYEVLELLQRVSIKKNIVGFDIMELCPSSVDKAPDFLAAKLIYKLLSFKFLKKR